MILSKILKQFYSISGDIFCYFEFKSSTVGDVIHHGVDQHNFGKNNVSVRQKCLTLLVVTLAFSHDDITVFLCKMSPSWDTLIFDDSRVRFKRKHTEQPEEPIIDNSSFSGLEDELIQDVNALQQNNRSKDFISIC